VISIEEIRGALASHAPAAIDAEGAAQAAVALLLRERSAGPDLLLIERAVREGDPWSGHMAFPGGRMQPGDDCARAAAERETLEEVGVPLRGAEPLGRLDDKPGNPEKRSRLVVSAYVYALSEPGPLVLNYEVREAFWFPVRELLDPERRVTHAVDELPFPGIRVGECERHVIWGLTYSFLESFFLALDHPLPNRWTAALRPYARGLGA
jgi:8-oxo-dGTP pyrophosphatase MutT (NUDIX family)